MAVTAPLAGRAQSAAESSSDAGSITNADLVKAYRSMLLSRKLDDKEIQLKRQSHIFFQISGAGHEAILVAAGMTLKPAYDWFYPYYRDRALCLQLGMTPLDMLLSAVGSKDDPNSGGRQMPSHWGVRALHIVSGSSATGMKALHAVGSADASVIFDRVAAIPERDSKYHADEVTYVSVGDGTTSEGEFWESINAACTRQLPVLFLIEDNGYAISVPVECQTPGGDVSKLLRSFPGLHVDSVDGTDFLASLKAMQEAVAYVRARKGPAVVHARVTRPYSHSYSDDETLYKTKEERDAESIRDPIKKMAQYLVANGIATESDLTELLAGVEAEVNDAANAALLAPKPAKSTATQWVYSPDVDPTSPAFDTPARPEGKPDTMVSAINRTLKDEMTRNPAIVVFGEDIADCSRHDALNVVPGKGGVFKLTHRLQKQFGDDRVFNAPIAEAAIIGRAIGMAIRGLKPVVEIQFFDYIWPAMMQLRDELSMMRYRSGNNYSCPMVVRVPIGGYLKGGGPYHSQSGESIFAHCPGLRIAFPSTAADAAGLLRTAIRCDDPVMFFEHKHLYRQTYTKNEYPGADFMLPFGKASLRQDGSDVLVVTWGALVQRTLVAAHQAEKEGITTAVLDLRTIAPYDWEAIAALVKKTSRVVVAHEDQLTCGFGAEIAARIAGELFQYLDAPIARVGALDAPVAYAPELEEAILPQTHDVLKAIRDTVRY